MSDRRYIGEEHDQLALLMRLQALSEDWYRLRDIELQWQRCSRWAMRALVLVLIVAALSACDTREKHCARWSATADMFAACAASAECQMDPYHFEHWQDARIERAMYCPKEAT